MKINLKKSNQADIDTTECVFRTAYYIAKNNRPYTDHPELIDLQLNGVNAGRVLHLNVVCADIIDSISEQMKKKVLYYIQQYPVPFSILTDESTSSSGIARLIIYLHYTFNDFPINIFIDLLELNATNSSEAANQILNCLYRQGFSDSYLLDNLLGFCSDGASVMTGSNTGVFTQLKQKFPWLVGCHCLNHRHELAVSDAAKACVAVNHFKYFMDSLYALYSTKSSRNKRELLVAAVKVEVCLLKIGRVLSTRWVASSFRTVKAVLHNFKALYLHFINASIDSTRDSKERSKFKGLAQTLASVSFLKNLALMYYALEELKST